ncbi:MAG TPA: ECF-type sigma factor [Gemmataceae bacterium]|nr:ECF-type sigma factor [Gemmataceae bacterium]
MPPRGSVTHLLQQLQAGNRAAVQPLWERYFRRLVGLARTKLRGDLRAIADEEDVALSAFDSFCRNAERGCFPQLADRDGLWRLLMVLTACKAAHVARDQGRQKRGGDGRPAAEALGSGDDEASVVGQVLSREPDPAFAAQMAEEYRRLLARLQDRELEMVAVWRMEGYTLEEIAERLRCVPRSVKRKLRLIRDLWEGEV